MVFWAISVGLALLCAVPVALAMARGRSAAAPAAAYDLKVYRDQLSEIDRDLARGVLSEEDAERLRTEVSRRILAADRALQGETEGSAAPVLSSRIIAALAFGVIVAGSLWVYGRLGAPGVPDLPMSARIAASDALRAERPDQATAEAVAPRMTVPEPDPAYIDLVEQLRTAMVERPEDLRGLTLLARAEANLGNFPAAHAVQAQLIAAKGDTATARDLMDYADMLIVATGGYVSPKAEETLARVLNLDPANGGARYYTGLMYSQIGRPDLAFAMWRRLLDESPPTAPWVGPIRAGIEAVAFRAGVDYRLPPPEPTGAPVAPPRGPTAEDMANAADMAPEDRTAFIESMVAGLAGRLASEGGPPEEWAQLIRAYGVLGRLDAAQAIWDEAQGVFGGSAAALALIAAAAEEAGVR
ncbi:MAG: c-type cytochrome biogenesis protein CcmI [Pseudomonadota bacterium]